MRRFYDEKKKVVPLVPVPSVPSKVTWEPWEDGRIFHDLEEAAEILTRLFGKGYAKATLYNKCRRGGLIEGLHWIRQGSLTKISIKNMVNHPPRN